jgi:predicted adenine nucleotide alpha hydrolase (AANH) superfamily ATPase
MVDQKKTIRADLANAETKTVLKVAGDMPEWSDRCNPCYSMRLDQAAKQAVEHQIPYFTSTLLISPKKHGGKLFDR